MYSYLNSFENIYKYQAKNNSIVYFSKLNKELVLNNLLITDDVHTFVFNGDSLIFSTENQAIFKISITDNNTKAKLLLENHTLGEIFYSTNEILVDNELTNERMIFNVQKEQIVFKLQKPPAFKTNEYLFFRKFPDPIVECLSLETGENLWETDISTYVSSLDGFSYKGERIGGILGVSENKLIIRVGTRLLMIDLKHGIITGDTEALSHEKNYSVGPAGFHSYLHLEGEYVYLLKRDRYLRIHLITGVLETLWINSQSDLIIEHVHYDENYAYFMACIGWNLQPEVLGVFDRKNLAIVWQYDQPIYSSQPPQSDGKKLYSLDTGGTLHVFERAI